MTFEQRVRAYEEAKRAYDNRVRKWLAKQDPKPTTEEELNVLERRYNVEHYEEVEILDSLALEVRVARAELDRRWVEAHEDLAVLRKAGITQPHA